MLHKFKQSSEQQGDPDMPLMGFGTFIGIESGTLDYIENREERFKVTTESIVNALAAGFRHLDLAEGYGNLDAIAAALKIAFQPKEQGGLGLKRQEVWLTMKADEPFSTEHIDSLLKSVGVEYFDLFLIHHSTSSMFRNETTLEQAWRNLANIDTKKLHHIGVSNCYEPHLSRLLAICERESLVFPYANEVEINLWSKNIDLIAYCHQHHIKMIAYSPLGYAAAPILLENENLKKLATSIGATAAQTALAWLMAKDIAVIPKTTKKARLTENFRSTEFIEPVKKHEHLSKEIDAEGDWPAVTETASASKAHGESLSWEVKKGPKPK